MNTGVMQNAALAAEKAAPRPRRAEPYQPVPGGRHRRRAAARSGAARGRPSSTQAGRRAARGAGRTPRGGRGRPRVAAATGERGWGPQGGGRARPRGSLAKECDR